MEKVVVFNHLSKCEQKLEWQDSQELLLINPKWPLKDQESILDLINKVPRMPGHIWLATSGTTAPSLAETKMVALAKAAFLAAAKSLNEKLGLQFWHKWGLALPLFHVGGLSILARAELTGAEVQVKPDSANWKPIEFVKWIQENKINLVSLVPTQIYDLVQTAQRAPESLNYVFVGGGFLDNFLYTQARQLGWPILTCYGMTETCALISLAKGMPKDRPGDLELLPHFQCRTTGDGNLAYAGSSLLSGYAQWQNGQAIFWDPKVDSWFVSEDKGIIDGTKMTLFGRDSDAIKILGELSNLSRLRHCFAESVLRVEPDKAMDWALVAESSLRNGHELVLYHVGQRAQWTAIEADYNGLVAAFEKIRKWVEVKQIPRTELGKIRYQNLAAFES